jgi:hypothetical protein
MAKLTDKQKKEIIADYVECQNYSETARKYNISDEYVRKLVNNNKDSWKQLEQKSKENTEEVLEAMKKRSKRKIQLLDKLFEAMDGKLDNIDMFTNIKDLATAYGIIMDKELKIYELRLKDKEISKPQETVQRIEIVNDLPRDDEDGNN